MVKTLKIYDAKAPKRPANPFFLWVKKTGQMKKVMKEKKFTRCAQVLKVCGARWKKLPEKEKMPYQQSATKAFEKYKLNVARYRKSPSFKKFAKIRKEQPKMKKKPRDPNKPTRPLSGYFRFIKQFRKKHPRMSITVSTKAAALQWKKLSEKQRSVYKSEAEKDMKKYAKILAKYKKSPKYKEYQENLKAFRKEQRKKLKKKLKAKNE